VLGEGTGAPRAASPDKASEFGMLVPALVVASAATRATVKEFLLRDEGRGCFEG
jgi:hypothetical protein